jgi:hypothetical protein
LDSPVYGVKEAFQDGVAKAGFGFLPWYDLLRTSCSCGGDLVEALLPGFVFEAGL